MNTENKTFGDGDTSFQAAGGKSGIEKLVNDFYDYMDSLPESRHIRSLHKPDLSDARQKLAWFLSGWLGGPALYQENVGSISIPGFHRKFDIGSEERDAWIFCMKKAIDEQKYDPDFTRYLIEQLFIPADRCRVRD